jgi:hypothetical protein
MNSYRNIWISLGISTAIALVGALLFRNVGAAPMQATAMVSVVVGILVLHALDGRELQDDERD